MMTVVFLDAEGNVKNWPNIDLVTFDPNGRPVFHNGTKEHADKYTSSTSRLADNCKLIAIVHN